MTTRSPVPEEVSLELKRAVQRWHQLPLDRALRHAPAVQATMQELADATATSTGRPPIGIPDLGPSVLADQLTVITYDACAAGLATHLDLAARLATLRRTLT